MQYNGGNALMIILYSLADRQALFLASGLPTNIPSGQKHLIIALRAAELYSALGFYVYLDRLQFTRTIVVTSARPYDLKDLLTRRPLLIQTTICY